MANRLTPEEIARIDAALEACKGSRKLAATALGVEYTRVCAAVKDNPVLRAKWIETGATEIEPGLDTELSRPNPVAAQGERVVNALNKQDAIIAKRGHKLPGFSNKEQKFFAGIMSVYAGNYKTAADFTHAGAVHAAGVLVVQLEKARERLQDIEDNPQEYQRTSMGLHGESITKSAADYWRETSDLIVKTADALRKMNASVLQSNELRLKIEKLRAEKAKTVKAEAGWEVSAPTNG